MLALRQNQLHWWGGGTRRKCPDVQKLLADNKGKLPPDYKGAFELSKMQISSLTASEQPGPEHPETQMPEIWWEALAAAAENQEGCRALRETTKPVSTKNSFSSLPVTDHDDVDNGIKALGDIAHTIHSGPTLTQKQRKQQQRKQDRPPPYTYEQIKTIAAAVNS